MGNKATAFSILNEYGELVCECGNEPWLSGFSPCLPDGTYTDYDEGWDEHYLCEDCGHIYHLKGAPVDEPLGSVGWVDLDTVGVLP